MNIFLWVAAGVVAAMFLIAGTLKATQPKEKLLPMMKWSATWSVPQLRSLGVVEILGALGLILPRAVNIAPVLTPVAAVGCAIVMIGAVIVHARAREYKEIVFPPAVLLILAIIVAAGRF